MTFASSGTLHYEFDPESGYKLTCSVDPEIVNLARALIPVRLNRQRYSPHITVIRNESILACAKTVWGAYEGKEVTFQYTTHIYNDDTYWWLRANSCEFVAIRTELMLPDFGRLSRPPDGADCFHITIGNTKS